MTSHPRHANRRKFLKTVGIVAADRGPTREEVLKDRKSKPFELCFAKRPEEELYDA